MGSESATKTDEARANAALALRRVEEGERDSLDGLRDALCAFIGALRDEGKSRTEAIGAVSELITSVPDAESASLLSPIAREALVQLSTHWCNEEFDRET